MSARATRQTYVYDGSFTGTDKPFFRILANMVNQAKEIRFAHFRNNCKGVQEVANSLGYAYNRRGGLTLYNDVMIQFYISELDGVPCMYFCRKGVRYVWLKGE